MPESSLNRYKNWPKHEILSKTCVPPENPLFIGLDGWRFKNSRRAQHMAIRWRIKENWSLPLFTEKDGQS